MPRFAIVDIIGKIAAAAPVLLPKIDGIDSPPPVEVAFVIVAVVAIVDKTLFDIVKLIPIYVHYVLRFQIQKGSEKYSRYYGQYLHYPLYSKTN
jgi:hypothetical protein